MRRVLRGWSRITATIRVVPLLALLATSAALVAFVVQHPEAAMWAVVVALVLALAGMVTLVVEVNAERAESEASHHANELLCSELACSDAITRRLRADLIDVCKRLSDYENGAEVIAFPSQRDPQHDSLAALDAEATEYTWPAIARDAWLDEITKPEGWL